MMDETQDTQQTPETQDAAPASAGAERTVSEVEAEMAQMKDQFLRAIADAENARRRAEKDAADSRVYAVEKFARDVLIVADNLGRALSATGAGQGEQGLMTLIEGVRMTEATLTDALLKHGVRRVAQKGDKFDPNLHQAVAQAPSPDTPAGHLADVLQPGYVLGERTLRAAMVVVSQGGETTGQSAGVDVKV